MADELSLAIPEDSGYSTTSTPCGTLEPKKHRNRSTGKRVSHKKSRTGCRTCKGRKVKCDEHRPSCSRCERLQLQCEYPTGPPDQEPSLTHSASSQSYGGDLEFLQLELLHTYSTFTYTTLSWSPALRDFWRVTVPSLALRHTYLMRSLLAIPALHMAQTRPNDRSHYVSAALEYHRISSKTARDMLERLSGDQDGVPLFLFSALNVIIAKKRILVLATPQRSSDGSILDEDASFHGLLAVLKGMNGILRHSWGSLSDSPLAPLLNHGAERWMFQQQLSQAETGYQLPDSSLDELAARLNAEVADLAELVVYARVIDMLSLEDFIPLLELRTQEALSVLAHFAVILKRCENQWWLQGWAVQIMSGVYQQLDHDHKHWIYRPAAEIGWVFPNSHE
ncbi:C6 zinc finger protein [Colletotrichum asianum]